MVKVLEGDHARESVRELRTATVFVERPSSIPRDKAAGVVDRQLAARTCAVVGNGGRFRI